MTLPIRKSITVPLGRDDAFDLFTDAIDSWWPKDSHSVSAETGDGGKARVRIEPEVGGRVIETRPDGSEAAWATVTDWQPGRRLSLDWHPGRDASDATQVDVTFNQTEAGTRVDLTHDGFDKIGTGAEMMCANYASGWDHVLTGCFGARCRARAA